MSLGEFQLISRFFQNIGQSVSPEKKPFPVNGHEPHLELGIGDDAAVISGLGNNRLAVSTDALIESVHFPKGANPKLLARRALRVNLSDMAAMGAQPKWFTLALTLPEVDENWLEAFSSGLHQDAQEFDCQLIGGDTTRGPLNIGIQVMGLIPKGQKAITRSGAKPDDLLVVTGTLGDAGAALSFDLNSFASNPETFTSRPSYEDFLLQRYWLPSPRVDFARHAQGLIHAACDVSDGLLADTGHLCEQSLVNANIRLDLLPLSPEYKEFCKEDINKAITMGDDYELCMAVPEVNMDGLKALARIHNVKVTEVGRFLSANSTDYSVTVVDSQGKNVKLTDRGYTHF